MAAFVFLQRRRRGLLRRNRIFRDRRHPLEVFDDIEIVRKFRFPRHAIFEIIDSVGDELRYVYQRRGCLTPALQICLALRFYATGTIQDAIAEMIGVDQSTASRTISRVTNALLTQINHHVRLPMRQEAEEAKVKFFRMQQIPRIIGCIDGTHVRIEAPSEYEHEFVNRKNFHSINVQVVCDADLMFINVVARWPGSVHDARILRESELFADFEGPRPSLDGILLGDSGYMVRPWLLTPLINPRTQRERHYNYAHSSTRTTVERCIGVAKQRWQCLRVGLRVKPEKACRIISVCLMLHNQARRLNLPDVQNQNNDPGSDSDSDAGDMDHDNDDQPVLAERARVAAGQAVRQRIIDGLA